MDELIQSPSVRMQVGTIEMAHFDAFKASLNELVKRYKNIAVTESKSDLKEAKKQRAELNRVLKKIDSERIRYKKNYLEPLEAFEGQCKSAQAIVQEARDELDQNIQAVEETLRLKKRQAVEQAIETHGDGYSIDMRPNWLNQTCRMADIIDDIRAEVQQRKSDEAMKKRDEEAIEQMARMNHLPPEPYWQMYAGNSELNAVLAAIARTVASQKQPSPEEPQPTVGEPPSGISEAFERTRVKQEEVHEQTFVDVIRIKGTAKQFRALNDFCQQIGIQVQRVNESK